MEIPFDKWYEAIFIRRSRRQFQKRRLSDTDISNIYSICENFRPFPEARAVFCNQPPEDVFKGAIGKYGKIKGADCFVAFIGRMDSPSANEKVGYTGEGIILEATALGLATCWVAGFYRPEIAAELAGAASNERVLAVSPIGYSDERWTLEERLMSGFGRSHKRKPLNELISAYQGEISNKIDIKTILEAARVAPSAVNRQPWRFTVESDGIIISTDNTNDSFNIPKRLDCGITMLHIEVASLKLGIKGKWQFLESPQVAKFIFDKA